MVLSLGVLCVRPGISQSNAPTVPSTEISADLGACSAQINVTGVDGKPLYGAKVTGRVQYGMLGVKRLDLEAFTGADGKVKIARLPETLKKPMFIHVSKDDKEDMVEFKPAERCHATFDVKLQ